MSLEKIKYAIDHLITINSSEWHSLSQHLTICRLQRNENFLTEGKICNSIAFINHGSLVYMKSLKDGNEAAIDFAFAGDWVTDNYSRLNYSPSLISIKAIEDSELVVLKNDILPALYNSIPILERLGRLLVEQAFIKITQQSIDLQVLSATERYLKLLEHYPLVFEKVPLYHIATFLGVAPKSLSRIRNEISQK